MASSYYDPSNRLIPGAGTYLQDQLKAKSAYERAVAQLKAQRARQQIHSGLNEKWEVDPRAQYGGYQAMLQGQGSELDQVQEGAQQRGFFGSGLGNQGQSMLRYGHAVQNLGFKNQLADWENEYQLGMSDAARAKAEADMAAMQGAYESAYESGDYTPYGGPSSQSAIRPPGFRLTGSSRSAVPPLLRKAAAMGARAKPVRRQRISGYQR